MEWEPAELLPIMPPIVARLAVEVSGPKRNPIGLQMKIELFLNYAWFDDRPSFLGVHFEHAIEIFRHVDDDRVADSLSREAGSASSWQDRDLEITCDFHRRRKHLREFAEEQRRSARFHKCWRRCCTSAVKRGRNGLRR